MSENKPTDLCSCGHTLEGHLHSFPETTPCSFLECPCEDFEVESVKSSDEFEQCAGCDHELYNHSGFTEFLPVRLDKLNFQIKKFRTMVCREKDCRCAIVKIYEISDLRLDNA